MSCYIVQETDGSKFELEDESGFLLLEQCDETPDQPAMGGTIAEVMAQARPPATTPVYHLVRGAEEEVEIILYLLSDS